MNMYQRKFLKMKIELNQLHDKKCHAFLLISFWTWMFLTKKASIKSQRRGITLFNQTLPPLYELCKGSFNNYVFRCRKFLVPKISHVETFQCLKVHLPERLQWQTVHVLKCSCDETSVPKWFMPKWSIGTKFGCHTAPSQQQMELNFELVLSN